MDNGRGPRITTKKCTDKNMWSQLWLCRLATWLHLYVILDCDGWDRNMGCMCVPQNYIQHFSYWWWWAHACTCVLQSPRSMLFDALLKGMLSLASWLSAWKVAARCGGFWNSLQNNSDLVPINWSTWSFKSLRSFSRTKEQKNVRSHYGTTYKEIY